jgi:hypothetical protein
LSCLTGNEKVGKLKKEEKYMFTTTSYTYSVQVPSAYVAIGKNRVKQYGNTVYMNDKQEFEIELFNPKSTPILVKIKLNGTYISTRGVYLKPGQRIFLDRFIDNNNKFLYSTYEVENSGEAKRAIANNGDVEIEFYDEYTPPQVIPVIPLGNYLYGGSFGQPKLSPFTYTTTAPEYNVFYSNSLGIATMDSLSRSVGSTMKSKTLKSSSVTNTSLNLNTLETGRVEKGVASNQSFTETWGNFNTYYSSRVYWKIAPQSQEPVQFVPQSNFCTSCGNKIKKESFKYCPNCGNKLK